MNIHDENCCQTILHNGMGYDSVIMRNGCIFDFVSITTNDCGAVVLYLSLSQHTGYLRNIKPALFDMMLNMDGRFFGFPLS